MSPPMHTFRRVQNRVSYVTLMGFFIAYVFFLIPKFCSSDAPFSSSAGGVGTFPQIAFLDEFMERAVVLFNCLDLRGRRA